MPDPVPGAPQSTKSSIATLQARQARLNAVVQRRNGGGARPDPRTPARSEVFGAPTARKGEDIMGSRGFKIQNLIGVTGGLLAPEQAKIELMQSAKLMKSITASGYQWAGTQSVCPLSMDFLADVVTDNDFRHEMKSMVAAGVSGVDPDEVRWLQGRMGAALARSRKASGVSPAQSWIDATLGEGLVPLAEQGELIQLLRNKEALINAGARVVPMPPQGSLRLPRQTSATTGYWLGENTQITLSTFGTGALLLRAKKACALVVLPGELLRFASPAAEAIVRDDLTKTLALTFDKGLLEGPGSDNVPLGLATMGASSGNPYGLSIVTPATANTLSPQDVYKFISGVEADNADFEGWIMRPELFYALLEVRGQTSSGTSNPYGPFVFNQFRAMADKFEKMLAGFKVTTTVQVAQTRGTGTQTYVLGGMWSDYIIAMFGVIEFMQSDQGIQLLQADQVAVRAMLTGDGAPRHPGAFAFADNLALTPGF